MPPIKRLRVLSLDGSGVYGLIEARLLRGLCERDPDFLSAGNIDLITGCSAGSVNTLLLALRENPRDAVLDGTLEKFWHETQEWDNSEPPMHIGSMMGLTPFFRRSSTFKLQERYFGRAKLGDLKQKVLISLFNWHGEKTHPELQEWPDDHDKPFFQQAMEAMLANFEAATKKIDVGEQTGYSGDKFWDFRHWGPISRSSVEHPDDYVTNIAYVAQTPPVARPYQYGLGDGASAALSPASLALSWSFEQMRNQIGTSPPVEAISLLSVGDGAILPYHWEKQSWFNGAKWFQQWPSNPFTGAWNAPSTYQFQGGAEEDNETVGRLLSDRFYRLNPGLMHRAMVASTYACGTAAQRDHIFRLIDEAFKTDTARRAMDQTATWLKSESWTQDTLPAS